MSTGNVRCALQAKDKYEYFICQAQSEGWAVASERWGKPQVREGKLGARSCEDRDLGLKNWERGRYPSRPLFSLGAPPPLCAGLSAPCKPALASLTTAAKGPGLWQRWPFAFLPPSLIFHLEQAHTRPLGIGAIRFERGLAAQGHVPATPWPPLPFGTSKGARRLSWKIPYVLGAPTWEDPREPSASANNPTP